MKNLPHPRHSGFALPTVLVMSGGLLILLAALMVVVNLERRTARVSSETFRAELAVESGLEEAMAVLTVVGSTDSFVIAEKVMGVAFDDDGDGEVSALEDGNLDLEAGERGRSYLYSIQGEVQGTTPRYRLTPLFTTSQDPGDVTAIDGKVPLPEQPGLASETERGLEPTTAVRGVRAKQPPVTNWRLVRNQEGDAVAQYSFWVEDMQGFIEPTLAPGSQTGRANSQWPNTDDWGAVFQTRAQAYQENLGEVPLWPAPGLNPGYAVSNSTSAAASRLLNQISLYSLKVDGEVAAGDALPIGSRDQTDFDDRIREVADRSPTPASLSMLYGAQGGGERVAEGIDRGRLIDEEARLLEENFTRGNLAWREQALVPFAPDLSGGVMGSERLNLNALLALPRPEAVNSISTLIGTALPQFANARRGGFTEDYLATLAANTLDYADEDNAPSVEEGVYRGIESAPLVSEFLRTTTYAWQETLDLPNNAFTSAVQGETANPFIRRNGRLLLGMTVRVYAELWNQTNHVAEGNYRFSYENRRSLAEGFLPETSFTDDFLLENNLSNSGGLSTGQSASFHNMERLDDGLWYFPAKQIRLEPNGYLLEFVGSVRYLFDVGPDSYFAASTMELLDGIEQSSFRLRWENPEGEFVLADWARGGVEVSELSNVDVRSRQSRTFSHVCANSYRELFGDFANGMGDLRMNYYANIPLTDSRYPGNYSPGRRNIRYETIYSRNEDLLYGRTLPSEWPDGGHDSTADWRNFNHSTNANLLPDAPQFMVRAQIEPRKAPVFISNLGRFVSESELGHIFDPMMWERSSGRTSEWTSSVANGAQESDKVGGGNTLRIGRPEHERFYRVSPNAGRGDTSQSAFRLLDLFHCGLPMSNDEAELRGSMRQVEGHVNINTAPRDVLRALAAGPLANDPEIATESSRHDTKNGLAPRTSPREISAPSQELEADLVADAIIAGRPYLTPSEVATATSYLDSSRSEEVLLGSPDFLPRGSSLQWNDQAAEEVFARVYNSSTVRSRNFRVHVIGQSLQRTPSGRYIVGSTKKKSYRVFVNRGSDNGAIVPENVRVEVINEVNQ